MMDIQRAEDMKGSLMWAAIVEEIDRKIHFETQKLRSCKPEELVGIQLKIACYESIKTLPDDVIDREA